MLIFVPHNQYLSMFHNKRNIINSFVTLDYLSMLEELQITQEDIEERLPFKK